MQCLRASGLLWAWGYLVHLLVSGSLVVDQSTAAGFAESTFLIASLVGYALVAAIAQQRGQKSERALSWFGCTAMMAGSGVLVLQIAGASLNGVLLHIASASAGLGVAFCATLWGVRLARIDLEALENVALSWCAVFAVVMFIVGVASLNPIIFQVISAILLMGMPLGAQVGLFRSYALQTQRISSSTNSEAQSSETQAPETQNAGEPFANTRFSREDKGVLINFFVAFFALSLIWFAISSMQSSNLGVTSILFAFAALILWGVLWVALRNTRRFGLSTLYRWALPFAVAGVACASADMPVLQVVAFVMIVTTNIGFDVVAKMFFVILGRRWRGHEALLFASGQAIINVAGLISSFMGEGLKSLVAQLGWITPMLFALVIFAVVVSIALGGAKVSLAAVAPETTKSSDAASQGDTASSPISNFCSTLEATYGLTPREAEVIALLAQGRSRSYVREALYISKGTVDTHAYHAYAKMGIRTRDDLLKLVHNNPSEKTDFPE